ncbi:MAG: Vitamin B12 dependent methionine synthase activation subunit [Clostridia bacterium]|nr:Vitamin B12 dependent methionine synthase activation subunit [Clostridia bacterium]
MIYLFNSEEKITADIKEVYRYSGVKSVSIDKSTEAFVLEIKEELEKAASFKLCYTKNEFNEKELSFGIGEVKSTALLKNLKGCQSVYIFAATAGVEVDRIINRYSTLSPARAVIAQAVGAALVEGWCDLFCESIAKEEKLNGMFLRPRFSPGYGDFDINYQKNIINTLDATKYTGVTLTDSLMMVPTKSVTAVMGVSEINNGCALSGCEMCDKENCQFRRNL